MRVRTANDDQHGVLLVTLSGPLEADSAATARTVLGAAAGSHPKMLVDLSDIEDVDPGLALVLLELDDRLAREGGWLWLVHGAGAAGSSLRYLGLYDRIRSSPSLAAAGWVEREAMGPARPTATPPARQTRALARRRVGGLVRTRRQ